MIIDCTNCNKKFKIDSNLIHENGRLVQCSSCNIQWFFKKEVKDTLPHPIINDVNSPEKNNLDIIVNDEKLTKDPINEKSNLEISKKETVYKKNRVNNFRILNFIIVFIITIIALILIFDTFQSPLSFLIPNIEFILYSLYETLKDIFLFLKDLI
tara:strand:+ start:139 stop:603 length:465 start_codon:yes stop_codon:yes gene_type:complete